VDVQDKLDALAELIENARAMPMSASCVVNRAEVLDQVEEIRVALPAQLAEAATLMARHDALVAEGRAEADRIIDAAYAEQGRLVGESEVHRQAQIEAERIIHEATTVAERMQDETDDYIDARLANFEIVLQKTLATVERGRAKLSGRTEKDALPEAASGANHEDALEDEPDRDPAP
jgi:cell division septum initiation protein DivIVA